MKKGELDFELPEELIAIHPSERRGASRLLVHHSARDESAHHAFSDLPQFFREGDLLVLNDTRVLPARLVLRKETGGRIEGLWLRPGGRIDEAQLMLSGGRLRTGLILVDSHQRATVELIEKLESGRWIARSLIGPWPGLLAEIGTSPLPPYIRRLRSVAGEEEIQVDDQERYQTIWANREGSIAAPTASLHFTEEMLRQLEVRGVQSAALTLHVGLGTFSPIEVEDVGDHRMHAEEYAVDPACARALDAARAEGRRVIAVGTTAARVLESLPADVEAGQGWTDCFILPGHRFRWVDGLLTNFHTPCSTLLAMVAALCQDQGGGGLEQLKRVYAEAVRERYRFYSYGDCSLWLP
ncbi:MAG: tRNA preQ1(34) S-adenosylmethionine ribosyltransferase-isomerase QueA [Planctomycetes bacterium]|nr:tRNA preQ1(34) S-adenosylmethionine ribosyltransferase-isomerase QueA [Planctomycetota bacterium]